MDFAILSNLTKRVLLGSCAFGVLVALSGCGIGVVVSGGGENTDPNGNTNGGTTSGTNSVDPSACNGELHLVGIYESHGNHSFENHPNGAASVHIERPGHSILALSSYEPVHWTITVADGVVLDQVILNGYHAQTADVPAGVPVEVKSLGAYAYAWPSAEGGSDTQGLVNQLESMTGRVLTSFQGCYQATSFTLYADLSADATCAVEQGYELSSYVAEADSSCGSTP